jgi:hypothetical protein
VAETGKSRPERKTPRGGAGTAAAASPKRQRKVEASPREPEPELTARLEAATRRQFELEDAADQTQAGLRALALARAAVWRIHAALLHETFAYDAARKASSSANELEVLAAKLERDSLADRIREVERKLSMKRKAGARLAKLDD